MKSLSNLRIGTRLGLSFAAVLGLMTITTAVGIYELRRIDALSAERDAAIARSDQFHEWQSNVKLNLARAVAVAASGFQAGAVAVIEPQMKATTEDISKLQKTLEAAADEGEKTAFADVATKRKVYIDLRKKAAEVFKEGSIAEGDKLVAGPMTEAATAYLGAIAAMKKHADDAAAERAAQVDGAISEGVAVCASLLLAALAAGAALAWTMTRSVTQPLAESIEAAQRIAAHDLTQTVPDTGRGDEIGALLRALRDMQSSLTTMVEQIRSGTGSVAGASSEIAAASTDLSHRTEQTSGSLQQTASTMEEITATVAQTADSARQANQLASSASSVAQRGGQVVSQVVQTMEQINASSKKIADIIGTVDGIAFQTNILALNAAVEAARAGEQGRGFAVVAGEVRSLAQRSAEAAREIKTLIGGSVEKVESGARLVADAGSTMNEIVAGVQRVADIIGEVMAAATEQSQGIGQVNTAIAGLDQMTQQNAALVEESTAAAESLREQADRLAALVATFRVPGSAGFSAPAATPTKPAPVRAQAAPVAAAVIARARDSARPAAPPAPKAEAPAAAPARPATPATPPAAPSNRADDDWETF
ncbi:methyl-accepting chemotaxis protein [Rubrivivax gelatinosus]|uniref:Methyl-accepting chemotaxis protein n=1 Tax=Rubrivivax gelatinosus (strain NBRC 100245 / IL144) TaxID=983917 RepID=I0HW87_RUBGI|nr:methyl-accepting chemotaxis protein [Rubrivivax gelatinosus]BAL97274.1 methyl-accepting chemotaxis protein [Rubrivivax gelatinosus IL144]